MGVSVVVCACVCVCVCLGVFVGKIVQFMGFVHCLSFFSVCLIVQVEFVCV